MCEKYVDKYFYDMEEKPIFSQVGSGRADQNQSPGTEDRDLSTDTVKRIRNLVGFWVLGLCNNFAYVVMLSAAYDLLHVDYHKSEEQVVIHNESNVTRCNPISTGAILLADILPSLFIKLIAPFIVIKTHVRVLIAIILSSLSFIITSASVGNWMTFLGVICAALSGGLGEVTFLSYSSFFEKDVISTWSSGTGGAGVFGALSYAGLHFVLDTKYILLVMLTIPVLTALVFWILIVHPVPVKCQCSSEMEPMLGDSIEMTKGNYSKPSELYSFRKKLSLVKPLLKYMIPLGLVYFAEYLINQGLFELLYFPNAEKWLNQKEQYRWYQVDYQIGVLISRSSVNFFQVKRLWILPILQIINVIILLLQIYFSFIPSIWIVLALIFYEGLLGGCAYVNTFYRISSEVAEEDKEFSMGVASLGDSVGIALAGAVSMPVHDRLCKFLWWSS
ncbi:Battenin, partial [Stegodyphus mimosarum]